MPNNRPPNNRKVVKDKVRAVASQQRPSSKPRPKGRSKGEDGRPRDRKGAA